MTESQSKRLQKLIDHFGIEKVEEYIHFFYPDALVDNLTKAQCQKIITGLGSKVSKPITGVYGRDFYGI